VLSALLRTLAPATLLRFLQRRLLSLSQALRLSNRQDKEQKIPLRTAAGFFVYVPAMISQALQQWGNEGPFLIL
jgi:hypothetical protein